MAFSKSVYFDFKFYVIICFETTKFYDIVLFGENMDKYIIFVDVDGTLLKPRTNVMPKVVADEFERIKKDGHIIVIVTGRALADIYAINGAKSATFAAALMGGVVADCKTGRIIKEPTVLKSDDVQKFVDEIEKIGLMWNYKNDYEQKTLYDYMTLKYLCHKVEKSEYLDDLKNNKICQLLVDKKIPQGIIDKFDMFDFFYMPTDYYDVIKKGFSKAEIVKYFAALHPDYKTVAIGDSNNDIAMLKQADISIAMGNAKNDLKKMCDYVTEDYEHFGVACAIKNILKI